MRTSVPAADIRDRHPSWPHTRQGDLPEFDLRKLGHRQREVLERVIAAYRIHQRGLTAADLGAKTPQDRGALYLVFNSLARRGLVLRDPPGVRGLIPALGADRIAEIETREAAAEPPAPVRVLFGKRIVPDDATGTAFKGMVAPARGNPFMPGENSGKLGDVVRKGRWRGMRMHSLTLEERATCPRSCAHWLDCYGNNSPQAKRLTHGPELEDRIKYWLWDMDRLNPQGYVVRPHMLGDYYSADYALMWREMLAVHKPLRVFGYTAHEPTSEIGRIVRSSRSIYRDRWAVRFSGATNYRFSAITIHRIPDKVRQPEGLVCPEQLGLVDSCADCGLCWTSPEPILFIDHAFLGAG